MDDLKELVERAVGAYQPTSDEEAIRHRVHRRQRTRRVVAIVVALAILALPGWLVWRALGTRTSPAVPGPITSRIVFTTQGPDDMTPRITVMEPNGAYLRVFAPGTEPAWSPDGSKIAFVRTSEDRSTGIYVMNADGSGVVRLTTNERGMDEGPTWSPDGRLIVFSRSEFVTLDPDPIASRARRDLYAVALDGTEPTKLLGGPTDDFSPAWSPDGSRIAFVRMEDPAADGLARIPQIWTVGADGSGASQVTTFGKGAWRPAWSPDGAELAFDDAGSDIYVVGSDGRGLHRIDLPSGWGEEAESPFDPTWSPDGDRIAFTAGGEQGHDIFVARLDGTDLENLSGPLTEDAEPMWLMPSAALPTSSPTPSEPDLYFPTKPGQDRAWMDALFEGPLVVRDGCVLIGRPGEYSLPVWPNGFTAEQDGSGRVVVRDAEGSVVATEGQTFEMGGGYVAEFRPKDKVEPRDDQLNRVEESLGYPIPERCVPSDVYGVWSVGET